MYVIMAWGHLGGAQGVGFRKLCFQIGVGVQICDSTSFCILDIVGCRERALQNSKLFHAVDMSVWTTLYLFRLPYGFSKYVRDTKIEPCIIGSFDSKP